MLLRKTVRWPHPLGQTGSGSNELGLRSGDECGGAQRQLTVAANQAAIDKVARCWDDRPANKRL